MSLGVNAPTLGFLLAYIPHKQTPISGGNSLSFEKSDFEKMSFNL